MLNMKLNKVTAQIITHKFRQNKLRKGNSALPRIKDKAG